MPLIYPWLCFLLIIDICSCKNRSNVSSEADLIEIGEAAEITPSSCSQRRPGEAASSIFSKQVEGLAIMLQTPCLETDSLGNMLSEYFESMLCASHLKVHFATTSFVNPSFLNQSSEQNLNTSRAFFGHLPKAVIHKDPINSASESADLLCPCVSMCHEWMRGLMHHNGNMARIGDLFRKAMDAWISDRLSVATAGGKGLRDKIIGAKLTKESLRERTSSAASYHKVIRSEGSDSFYAEPLPFIPETAVHYRCGDNLVAHYGFVFFGAIKRVIPHDTKTIYVMAESSTRRANKKESVLRCDSIFAALGRYLHEHFPAADVVVLRGQDIIDDLARLTYAKTVVCSVSTFCLWPAVASGGAAGSTTEGTRAYYPPTRLIAKGNTSMDYGRSGFTWMQPDEIKLGREAVKMSINRLVTILKE